MGTFRQMRFEVRLSGMGRRSAFIGRREGFCGRFQQVGGFAGAPGLHTDAGGKSGRATGHGKQWGLDEHGTWAPMDRELPVAQLAVIGRMRILVSIAR